MPSADEGAADDEETADDATDEGGVEEASRLAGVWSSPSPRTGPAASRMQRSVLSRCRREQNSSLAPSSRARVSAMAEKTPTRFLSFVTDASESRSNARVVLAPKPGSGE